MNNTKTYNPLKTNRAAHRKALINEGLYGRFKQSSVPSAKSFKRKQRNGKDYLEA